MVLPNAWVNERKREYYYRKAKEENFRSRASYKLLQAVTKYKFIKPGYVVVDLGAAPGGWTQAARKLVEDTGFVLAVDLKQIAPFDESNVRTIIGDISEPQTVEEVMEFLPRSVDVVISDVAPNVSGIWELDNARQIDLAQKSLKVAANVLRYGGSFFVKVFQGSSTKRFIDEVRRQFSFVKVVKPRASRSKSAEMYVLGMNYKKKNMR
ncbi:MAG: 23S rRNA (uridine(2552)-2'-O)-methyltransferase [Candidatus Bathyarchaeum sp.]|nr:MAG: 23S rRNA (uridine(2552)-2'-O)-methyltransferase [Candidatus Bathyarchaeum sp.]